ncbi:MAG TPA: hypothetical protein VEK08_03005 [Planctomycetota bacterium]|nr:hypothetical protein [Planctomycetota bacterium]
MTIAPKRGATLIMVAGVLAILSALATGFYTVMLMQTRSATRYSDSVRAEMLARAGVDYAIASLRDLTFKATEDPASPWYMWDYLHGAKRTISFPADLSKNKFDDDHDGVSDNVGTAERPGEERMAFSGSLSSTAGPNSERFLLSVHDAASRINVNACDNLGVLLDNLCRIIGAPLVAADQALLTPRVWEWYGGDAYNKDANDWPTAGTKGGTYGHVPLDIYYHIFAGNKLVQLYNPDRSVNTSTIGHSARRNQAPYSGYLSSARDSSAVFGDGYAIAAYRARKGRFKYLEEVKHALTYVERSVPPNDLPDDPLEQLEVEVKFAALRDYITTSSWVDTTTVCVGKFEWAPGPKSSGDAWVLAIDRDKSWVPDDPINDPENLRGSLRGSYVAIINGHGAGQVRRIRTNGIDWIEIESFLDSEGNKIGWLIPPGPTSSYMIYAAEDAELTDVNGALEVASGRPQSSLVPHRYVAAPGKPLALPPNPLPAERPALFPAVVVEGGAQSFIDNPGIDYAARPLCIHRAPININTASDKVLAALFMGINVTHGHFLAIGTDADMSVLAKFDPLKNKYESRKRGQSYPPKAWIVGDYDQPDCTRTIEPYILTPRGLKRIPGSSGKLVYDVDFKNRILSKLPPEYDFNYLNSYGAADPAGSTNINEAMELAFRIIVARTREPDKASPGGYRNDYFDPQTGIMKSTGEESYRRGPFTSWDDLYFRVIKPWDDARVNEGYTSGKQKPSVARLIMAHFNPNTDILKFNPNIEWIDRWGRNFTAMEPIMIYTNTPESNIGNSWGHGALDVRVSKPTDITVCDQDGRMDDTAVPVFCRERLPWGPNSTMFFVNGPYGVLPKWQGTYITRGFRYKTDEMIDKTDLNRSTTEFSFASHGLFEIQSLGQVTKRGEVLAERKVQAQVKVYDVWCESTQRQFVNGYITRATGATGTPQSGTVARDFKNVDSRLALNTLPEPLVPLRYAIKDPTTGAKNERNAEVVDVELGEPSKKRNAWGQPVDINMPLVVANNVLPAAWDGQIVLATNTLRYESEKSNPNGDCDTFLASFNGDLDTATCQGNGHEQAKSPLDCKVQSLDSFGVLGAINDNQFDADPGLAGSPAYNSKGTHVKPDLPPYTQSPLEIYRFKTALNALRGLDPRFYWNNCTARQGDLRAEGVFVGGPGVAGNDGVMKYLCGVSDGKPSDDPSNYFTQNFGLNGKDGVRVRGEDWNNQGKKGKTEGVLITMWAKTQWRHNDGRTHEFFDCSTPGYGTHGIRAEAFFLRKQGYAQYAVSEFHSKGSGVITSTDDMRIGDDPTWGVSGGGNRVDDLCWVSEPEQNGMADWSDSDFVLMLYGGTSGVPQERLDPGHSAYKPESPAYRLQPFRWHHLGMRIQLQDDFSKATNPGDTTRPTQHAFKSGFWRWNEDAGKTGYEDNNARWVSQNLFRPFVDSERFSDGVNYEDKGKYWTVHQAADATGFVSYQNKGRVGSTGGWPEGGVSYNWGPGRGDGGQPVRYTWAHPGGTDTADGKKVTDHPIFGLNNCNPGMNYAGVGNDFNSIYRSVPEEGTFAVIDEYKISRKEVALKNGFRWSGSAASEDRVTRNDADKPGEMTLSRYYLPQDPRSRSNCPQFTSQTLLQSLKGFQNKTSSNPEYVTLSRVTWTVFTPRFLHENKTWNKSSPKFARNETITKRGPNAGIPVQSGDLLPLPLSRIPFRGPFDYCKYNDLKGEIYEDYADPKYNSDMDVVPFRCDRAAPAVYQSLAEYKADKSYHGSLGVEVAVLEDSSEMPDDGNEKILGNGGKPFSNPDALNQILEGGKPVRVRSDRLRYRVWFRYPTDQLADPGGPKDDRGHTCVYPGPNGPLEGQYLLDTPVFDDISITYFTKPRILDYRDVSE